MSSNLELTIKGNIENQIFNSLIAIPALASLAGPLRPLVINLANVLAPQIVKSVFQSSSSSYDQITSNLQGPVDPFNLVNGNLSSAGLTENLLPSVSSSVQGPLILTGYNLLYPSIQRAFPSLFNNPLTSVIIAGLINSTVRSVVASQVPVAVRGYTDTVFTASSGPPPSFLGSTTDFEGIFLSDDDGYAATEQLSSALAQKYLQQARNFDIDNASNKEKLIATKQGFIDPEANYPTKEYSGQAETNRLAQGDIRGTVVQDKNLNRLKGAKLPGGESWDQPMVPFKGQYPYNKVTETERGHIIEVDDTAGAERLHVYHRSGTFIEIDSTGSTVIRTAGSKYEIIDRNGKIAIRGRADISVAGECNIFVGNNANIEVEGNTNITCHNDTTLQTGGNAYISATENFFLTAGNVYVESRYDTHIKSNANVFVSSHLDTHLKSNANVFVSSHLDTHLKSNAGIFTSSDLDTNIKSNSKLILNSKLNATVKSDAQLFLTSQGNQHLLSSSKIYIDGSETYINSNKAGSGDDSGDKVKASILAKISKAGLLYDRERGTGRRSIQDIELSDPVALTLADTLALKLEELENETQVAVQKDLILKSGFSDRDSYDEKPVIVEVSSSKNNAPAAVPPNENVKKVTVLPGNYNLSPNFTLEMLTTKSAITKFTITEEEISTNRDSTNSAGPVTNRFTNKYGDVVYNLHALSLNILEPAYNIFPELIIASAYRPASESSPNSIHYSGKAVDIIFDGATREEVYEKARILEENLKYTDFYLEYCSYTKNSWIHISYDVNSSVSNPPITLYNGSKLINGLAKIL